MRIELICFIVGILAVGVSVRPFLGHIKKHKVKVSFTLPGWTLIIFLLGFFLGSRFSKNDEWKSSMILLILFGFIPLYAWIDAKLIYPKDTWGVKEYIWACMYELGVVCIGASAYLFLIKLR